MFHRYIFTAILCMSVALGWADEQEHKPFIESVTGSISANTLTLNATMNYANIENTIKESVKYHWKKGSAAPETTTIAQYTENNALTMENIQWEVYATYTLNEVEYTTNTVTYTQTPPVVKLNGVVSGDNLNLTASCHNYDGQLTNISYNWFTYTYDAEGVATRIDDTDNHNATKTVPELRFEEEVWHVEATYTYSEQSYTTEPDRYMQAATPLPTLSVTKNEDHEQGHDQLIMNASLSPDYSGKITNLQYHWSNNAVEQTGNDAHREVQHSFDTQLWRCWATFTYDGKDYTTNDDTYTYYSTLGQLHFIAVQQPDETILATLQEAGSLESDIKVAYTWKDSKNGSGTGTSYTRQNNAEWVEFTATITQNGTSNQLVKHAFYSFDGAHTVVYIKYNGGGNDKNDGKTPDTPVATWKQAYKLLNNGGWDQNIIVIVNGTGTSNLTIRETDTEGKAATITGQWPWDGSTLNFDANGTGRVYVSAAQSTTTYNARIGGPTRFKNVVFWTNESSQARLSCYLHDIEFDTGVVMKNFKDLDKSAGLINDNKHKSPHFHLQFYGDQLAQDDFPQDKNKVMQVTIKSGQFGRILASRIAGTKAKNTYIIGRHDNPFKINITIDIQDPNNRTAGGIQYTDDIGYIASGLTQGMMWGDVTMNIKRGRIATLVAGSQGNALKMGDLKVPVSTYCGRSVINVMAENDADVVIENYCGGCQGRVYGSEGVCDAYFYGKSTLNMSGGTIQGDIFASSAGISGLRSDDPDYFAKKWYTPDQRIPYPGSYAYYIDYLPYDRNKQIVTMTTHNGTIDLDNTEIKINISGGIVNNVYGGSYGNSDPLDVVAYAPAHAGRLFGNTSVNISGGTVKGSIYGGGKGSTRYYDMATTDKQRSNFLDVAQVYGNSNVTITGTPNITGNIYGGGAGVAATATEEFHEIARVYGNTNIIFNADYTDDNPFTGNIYGGGAKGGVMGNTNVLIQKGVIVGNVYGGGEGQEGYSNKAKVVGTTKVVIGE